MTLETFLQAVAKAGKKLVTLLVDRRLIAYVAVVIGTVAGFPQLADNADALNDQAVQAVTLIVQGATILVGLISLLHSWTKRAPSGLDFDKIVYDRTKEIERIFEILKDETK